MDKIKKNPDRLAVLQNIEEYETQGLFYQDVEENPPWKPLKASKMDLIKRNPFNKLKALIATFFGRRFFENSLHKKEWIFAGATGIEHLNGFKGGAMVTCNHFNRVDNYAVYLALKKHFKKYRLHRIVREGNYSFKGLLGFLLRNGDTLPIGDRFELLSKCTAAVGVNLKKNKKILIYPEQAMWWNYKKPRPLKKGAFMFATKFNVPVIPCFISLKDSEIIGADGFMVQEYTVNILPLIYPDKKLSVNENCERMKTKNFELWKTCYEDIYKTELTYGDKK